MTVSSLRGSRTGSARSGSRGSGSGSENTVYFYEYEYEYEINTRTVSSYRPSSFRRSASSSQSSALGSYRMSTESGYDTVQVFGYGINLI